MSSMEKDRFSLDRWNEGLFSVENIELLAQREIDRLCGGETSGYKCVIVEADGKSETSTLGRAVEKDVFFEFFKNDINMMREEYALYDDASVFLIAIDVAHRQPVGVVRFIKDSPAGQKSLSDIASADHAWGLSADDLMSRTGGIDLIAPSASLDVATLAITPDYRAKNTPGMDEIGDCPDTETLSAHLYYSMYQWTRNNGYSNWFGILDTRPLEKIQMLNNPLNFFDGVLAAPYLDSESSIPFFANMDQIDERTKAVGIDDFFLLGVGLDKKIAIDPSIVASTAHVHARIS